MLKKQRHWGIITLNFVMFFLSLTLFGGSGISLRLFGAVPIVALSLLSAYSSFNSLSSSAVAGVISGAAMDSISANTYCFNTIAFLLIAVLAHLLSRSVFNRNLKAQITLCLMLTFLYYVVYWLLFVGFSLSYGDNLRYFLQSALPSAIYTAALTTPFYFIYKKFEKLQSEV